jgi:DNA polymerase I-like protein with 3'-5' exonuclease and polymerase domains
VYVRSFLAKNWAGPVALDNALRCTPKTDKFDEEEVAACRPYLAQTFAQVAPQRIFAMGSTAVESVLGRSPAVMSVRRGYGWTSEGIPVFLFPNPVVALKNRILRQRLEEDMLWALTVDLKTLTKPWDFKDFSVVETPEDAESAVTVLSMSEWVAYDTETVGVMYDPSFSVIAVSVSTPRGEVFAWGAEALKDPAVVAPLVRLLADSRIKKVGQNVKYDAHAVEFGLGVTAKGHVGDTQLWRHLLESDVAADLETQAELVGLGGHKAEAQTHRDAAIKAIRLMRSNRKKLGDLAGYEEIFEKAQSTKAGHDLVSTPLLEAATLLHETEPEKWAYGMVPEEVLLRYNARDALTTAKLGQLLEARLAANEGAKHVWDDVVVGASEAIQRIESWGMLVDRQALRAYQQHLSDLRLECEKLFSDYPGFNPASTPAVRKLLYTDLGLPVLNNTEKGAASTDAATLQALGVKFPKHKVLQALLEWRKIAKLDGTYAQGLEEHVRADGRIHPTLKIDGAASGRMSCVAPWTKIRTYAGMKHISDVVPGDFVWTHQERWRRVVNAFKNGVRHVFDVTFSNGNVLTCTNNHRLLNMEGRWVYVQELLGEHFQVMGFGPAEHSGGSASLQVGRHTDGSKHCFESENHVSERFGCSSTRDARTGEENTSQGPVFHLQNRVQESYEGEEGFLASQLEGGLRRWLRVSDSSSGRAEEFCAPYCHVRGIGGGDSGSIRCASYRWQPAQQCNRQPRYSNQEGASDHTFFAGTGVEPVRIAQLHYRGSCEVFDLTVDEDESYESLGVFSHNCKEPNLQNIPRVDPSTPWGKYPRGLFVAPEGFSYLQLDYSQLELRIAAMLSQDLDMIQIFRDGVDYHQRTAELIAPYAWRIRPEEVTKEHRTQAKTVNFAVLYGEKAKALAAQMNCSEQQAETTMRALFGQFKALRKWMDRALDTTQRTGYARTWWAGKTARCRDLADIAGLEPARKITAENSAVNTPIQGTASDFCLRSVVEVVRWIESTRAPAKLVLTVHDSLLLEVEEAAIHAVATKVRDIMTGWDSAGVPLAVDTEVGKSWGTLEKFTL